ncbi:MAG: hypothetical protein ABH819_03750 [Patescibacteria group bacterium]|nr:hypothetical protein [Patescibacteria group bacterium]
MPKKLLRNIAIGLLFIPLGFLLLFTVGEVFSGDISGLSHLIQMAPIILLVFVAWKKPFVGGGLLTIISLILGILYAINFPFVFWTIVLVEAFLFVPPFISGVLLILSSKKK